MAQHFPHGRPCQAGVLFTGTLCLPYCPMFFSFSLKCFLLHVFSYYPAHKNFLFSCFCLFCFVETVSLCILGCPITHSVDQAGHKFTAIRLPLPPEFWVYTDMCYHYPTNTKLFFASPGGCKSHHHFICLFPPVSLSVSGPECPWALCAHTHPLSPTASGSRRQVFDSIYRRRYFKPQHLLGFLFTLYCRPVHHFVNHGPQDKI